jgi:hypothetical protein
MARLLRGKNPYEHKTFKVSTIQILDQAIVASKLGRRTMKLALGLQNLIKMASEIKE